MASNVDSGLRFSAADILRIVGGATDLAQTLRPDQKVVFVTPGSGNIVLTLPPPAECPWQFMYVESIANDSGTVTVKSTEATPLVNAVLTTTGDQVLVLSNGVQWKTLIDITT